MNSRTFPKTCCIALFTMFCLVTNVTFAQSDASKDCEELKKDISALQDALVETTTALHDLEQRLDKQRAVHQKALDGFKKFQKSVFYNLYTDEFKGELLDKMAKSAEAMRKLRNAIDEANLTIEALKDEIADLLNKLADCRKKKPGNAPTPTPSPTQTPASKTIGMFVPQGQPTLAMLASNSQVKIDSEGTGETIGHVADLIVQNLTDQRLICAIPPMILESGSGKNQDYACRKGQTVALNPHQEKTVPMDGVCVNRSKPPVGKGVTGDLVINEGNPTIPQNPNSHVPPKDANKLLRLCTSKYDAADKLQKDGQLKNLPYHDPQKQKDIVTQWSTWMDPQICQLLGTPPATKEDLRKVVYKQVPEPMTPETKKKIDKGIDTIFEKVELTTAKAKDLEKPDQYAQTEPPNSMFEVSDQQGKPAETPPPQTQEKPKKKKQKEKDFNLSAPLTDWFIKLVAAYEADGKKERAQDDYKRQLNNFFKKNQQHGELEEKVKKIQGTLSNPLNNNSAAENDKLIKERDDLTKELTKLEGELEKGFQKTDEGKNALVAKGDAEKAANDARKAEEEAGKYIDKEALTKGGLEQLQKEARDKARREP